MRPLWQVLITFKDSSASNSLNCDECFLIMEHLADEALAGVNEEELKSAIKQHLRYCLDCQEHHLQRLSEIEEKQQIPENETKMG